MQCVVWSVLSVVWGDRGCSNRQEAAVSCTLHCHVVLCCDVLRSVVWCEEDDKSTVQCSAVPDANPSPAGSKCINLQQGKNEREFI